MHDLLWRVQVSFGDKHPFSKVKRLPDSPVVHFVALNKTGLPTQVKLAYGLVKGTIRPLTMRTTLPLRAKKMIGMFLIVVLVVVYAFAAIAIASATLATAPWYAHTLYFMFSGVLWVLPAMVIIKWMATES